MYNHIRSEAVGYLGSVFFFCILYIIGNLILTNLFLAILLKNFETPPRKFENLKTDKH